MTKTDTTKIPRTLAQMFADDFSADSLRQLAHHAEAALRYKDSYNYTPEEAKAFEDLRSSCLAIVEMQRESES